MPAFFVPFLAFAGWPFQGVYRSSLAGTRQDATVCLSAVAAFLQPVFLQPRRSGAFFYLWFPKRWRFPRARAPLDAECDAPVQVMLLWFERLPGAVRLWPGLRVGPKGGYPARLLRSLMVQDAGVTLSPSTSRRMRFLAGLRWAWRRVRNSRSLETLV